MVWFWAGGVIGRFFFETDQLSAVTVNKEQYQAMISIQLRPNLEELEIDNFGFQQGGATCYTSRETLALQKISVTSNILAW